MSKIRPKKIKKEQVELLINDSNWKVYEVPKEKWNELPVFLDSESTKMIVASGNLNIGDSKIIHGLNAICGFDWIKKENNRKVDEPEFNAYHFVVTYNTDGQYYFFGPYKKKIPINHWPNEIDFNEYMRRIEVII